MASLAGLEAPGRADGDAALVGQRAAQREHEDGADDGRDREAEDRARHSGDLGADQDAREDDDRRDADRLRHDPRLDQVHDHEPADPHPDERRRASRPGR